MSACFCDIRLLQEQEKKGGEKSENHWRVSRDLFFWEVRNEIANEDEALQKYRYVNSR